MPLSGRFSASRKNYLKIFFLGLAVSLAFFLPYLIMDGGLFLYYGDFNVQQIPFYSMAHDAVRAGDTGWNWTTDLGANFVGSYAFYLLGSPFFWLTIPFPSEALPYLMAPLLMLKFALTAVTGYAYVKRFTRTEDGAFLGGLLYAFSGFNLYNIFFNHFNEAVLVFPLLLIGMEELLINGRRGGFALAVALCALVNYYFFFGEVLFCLLYFALRARAFQINRKKFLILFLEAVLGTLLAGVLLLPSFFAVMDNPRAGEILNGYSLVVYGDPQRYGLILSSFFFPPDIPARPNFFPDSNAKWSSVSMWLPVFSVTGVFAFFKLRGKNWIKTLLTVCFVVCFIPGLNALFSLLNYSYYARWFYMPLLLMSAATCCALEDCDTPKGAAALKSGIKWTGVFVAAFALIGVLPKKVNGHLRWFSMPPYPERLWAYVLIAAIGLFCTGMLLMLAQKRRAFYRCAAACVCVVTVISGIFMIYTGKLASGFNIEENGQRAYYNQVAEEALHGREKLSLEEDGFYRIDTYDELDNLGMFWRIPTINAFHSVVPASIMEFYDAIGGERSVASRPEPSLTGVRALCSVKYVFVRQGKAAPDIPGFVYWETQNNYNIYRNEHFVPMGFTYDYFVTERQLARCEEEKRSRLLVKGMLLSDEDLETYGNLLPTLPDEEINPVYDSTADEDEAYLAACDVLAGNAISSFAVEKTGFSASANLEEANLVFFSVPYDRGWTATVNGIETEIVKANGGFMAVKVPTGVSTIRFTYRTPGLLWGGIISLIALALFIGYLLLCRRARRLHPELAYRRYVHRWSEENVPPIAAEEAYLTVLTRRPKREDGSGEDASESAPENGASGEGSPEEEAAKEGGSPEKADAPKEG